ncbi:hypothetical protein [Agromyces mangrovi Wang et al. 2018]|uniref:hypothetical protein n=1 Tax=Agromyces mangrovi TaxID=1858653 RepID=UPI0025740C8D|nr:hypothetical protein [Agromyces mangrovi]
MSSRDAVVVSLGSVLVGLGSAALVFVVDVWSAYERADAAMRPYIVSGPNAAGVQWVWLVALAVVVAALVVGRGRRMRLVAPLVVVLAVNPLTEFFVLTPLTGTWDEPIWYGTLQAAAMVAAGALVVAAAWRRGRADASGAGARSGASAPAAVAEDA